MITVTVTETTMVVMSHGEVDELEWREIIYSHGLADRLLDIVDYRVSRSDDGDLIHYWKFLFAPQIAEPKAVSL